MPSGRVRYDFSCNGDVKKLMISKGVSYAYLADVMGCSMKKICNLLNHPLSETERGLLEQAVELAAQRMRTQPRVAVDSHKTTVYRNTNNTKLKVYLLEHDIDYQMIAKQTNYSYGSISKWFTQELTGRRRRIILNAIREIEAERQSG